MIAQAMGRGDSVVSEFGVSPSLTPIEDELDDLTDRTVGAFAHRRATVKARLARGQAALTERASLVFPLLAGQATGGTVLLHDVPARPMLAIGIGLLCVFAFVMGVRMHLPHGRVDWREEPWLLAALGLLAFVGAGAAAWHAVPSATSPNNWLIAVALAHLAGFALLAKGAVELIRERARGTQLYSLFEAAIGASVLATIGWVVAIDPLVSSNRVRLDVGLTALLLPITDCVLLALTAKLAFLAGREDRTFRFMAGAMGVLLVSDSVRAASFVGWLAPSRVPTFVELLAFILMAAAALDVSITKAHRVTPRASTTVRQRKLAALAGATLIGPVLLLVEAVGFINLRDRAVALSTAALSVFVVVYLVNLVADKAKVEQMALHDDLTGLPNRVLFHDRVNVARAHADRSASLLALMFIDLDRFKTINDSLGHAAGNELLQGVARRLRETVREEDTVARLAGDEFAVLLPGIEDAGAASLVAEKIVAAFSESFTVAKRQLFISPSIGVAVYPGDGETAEALLKNADAAMYRAKEQGRNGFRRYSADMNAKAKERLAVENSLHTAIERGELSLHYQPRLDLRTGRIVGMEALARWDHPQLGRVSPGEFIPMAEETGLIVQLGEWALTEACQQVRTWVDAGLPPIVVAVNLSARQFQQVRIGDLVASTLRKTNLPAELLELELTESLALQETETVRATLLDLKEMGVRCSIDDFGTGYSGLHYLTRFPIDALKIDKSFVSRIADGGDDARLVAAVIGLAHGLRMRVIAEGVETDEQLDFLLENGCDEMQGYLFSAPIPAEEMERLLMIRAALPGSGLERLARHIAAKSTPIAA